MSDQPFRERRIPPEEVQRVVQRALELAAKDAKSTEGKALTGAELEARLHELGVSPEIARIALEPKATPIVPAAGGVIRVEREVELEGALSPEHFERIADAIQVVMKMPGRVSAVGNKLTWTPGGAMLEPSVTVHAKDGRTVIRYFETLGNSGQLKVGFGVLSGIAALGSGTTVTLAGVAIAKAADVSKASGVPLVLGLGALFAVTTAIGSFLALRRSFARRSEGRSRFADEVVVRVAREVEASLAVKAPKTRIDASNVTQPDPDTEGERTVDDDEDSVARVERRR
jgi:hypothetical protein